MSSSQKGAPNYYPDRIGKWVMGDVIKTLKQSRGITLLDFRKNRKRSICALCKFYTVVHDKNNGEQFVFCFSKKSKFNRNFINGDDIACPNFLLAKPLTDEDIARAVKAIREWKKKLIPSNSAGWRPWADSPDADPVDSFKLPSNSNSPMISLGLDSDSLKNLR